MKFKYKTISLRSESGFTEAEKLKDDGWEVVSVGWDTIQLCKKGDR